MNLLGFKQTHGRVDKAIDEIINKTDAEYRQSELNEKGEKTGKVFFFTKKKFDPCLGPSVSNKS